MYSDYDFSLSISQLLSFYMIGSSLISRKFDALGFEIYSKQLNETIFAKSYEIDLKLSLKLVIK